MVDNERITFELLLRPPVRPCLPAKPRAAPTPALPPPARPPPARPPVPFRLVRIKWTSEVIYDEIFHDDRHQLSLEGWNFQIKFAYHLDDYQLSSNHSSMLYIQGH
uniref:Uncharacterized protein n=1 Tax=Tetranychus urticae TaxID=32264 RepID=T1K880_TETUR